MIDKTRHRDETLSYFDEVAEKRAGFFDSQDSERQRPSIWQRRVRGRLDRAFARLLPDARRCLDVACGNGDYLCELADAYPEVRFRGHDFNEKMIALANDRLASRPAGGLEFAVADLLNAEPGLEPFDVVLCLNVFHHLHESDLERGMDALALLTGRHLLFEIKNGENFWNRRFRSTGEFPATLISPTRVVSHLDSRGLRCVDRWNIFGVGSLSPIVVLEFEQVG